MMTVFTSQRICVFCSISVIIFGTILLYIHVYYSQSIPSILLKFPYRITDIENSMLSQRPECPRDTPNAVGHLDISKTVPTWSHLVEEYTSSSFQPKIVLSQTRYDTSTNLTRVVVVNSTSNAENKTQSLEKFVGMWRPVDCDPTERLAIIVPYRNRDSHLRMFLEHMHSFLRKQRLMYTIFVINQDGTTHFNRALLLNIGFIESMRVAKFDCFIFHDVDLLPEDDRNTYRCSNQPRHLSVAVDKFSYHLPYQQIFGGAVALTREQFVKVGGFSNLYYGWGGEDDDLYARVINAKYIIVRYPEEIARYKMISHNRDPNNPVNPQRQKLLDSASSRFKTDGYWNANYTLLEAYPAYNGLFYWVSVSVIN
uniref:Beta-1,4-galactosyltransferase n=1 Tax=Trichobilharzia regenti TaxID=157069 RepID=A0AA85ITS5_TRIRE|nr:unnamed protein product [Trichobilharzia regenti]